MEVPEATRSTLSGIARGSSECEVPHLSIPELPHRTNGLRIAWSPIMRNYDSSGNRESLLRRILQVNSILVGQPIMQALKIFVTASDGAASPEKAQKNKIKCLIGLIMAVAFVSAPVLAQE